MELKLRDCYSKSECIHLSEQLDIADIVKRETSIHNASDFLVDVDACAETSSSVVVHGHVEGQLELVCSRCLKLFPNPISFSFEEVFSQETPPEEVNEAEDERMINYVTEDRVDLVPYIKENIQLELPRFPLCSNHCKGLCAKCGCNKNTEACACDEETTDPRWSGLKDLLRSE